MSRLIAMALLACLLAGCGGGSVATASAPTQRTTHPNP